MNIQLSERMQAVADMALPGYRVADIGCDHGFVSIYLVQAGIAPRVYAADVRPGPLSRAKEHIGQAGLESYIMPVLSDGLEKVPVSAEDCCAKDIPAEQKADGIGAQAMIAAGIGGRLTIKILSDWPEKTKNLSWMVLEPQSDIHLVRRWISENGFFCLKENLVYEDGKYYPVLFAANRVDSRFEEEIAACRTEQAKWAVCWAAAGFPEKHWSMACDLFGFWLIRAKHPVLQQYLLHTIEKDRELLAGMGNAAFSARELSEKMQAGEDVHARCGAGRIGQRMAEITEKISICEQVLAFMKNSQPISG